MTAGAIEPENLRRRLRELRPAFVAVGLFSGVVNLLALTGSLYMLQLYDRVLTSRSIPTLVGLTVIAIGLYVFQCALDVIRARLLARIANSYCDVIAANAFRQVLRLPLHINVAGDGQQPLRDVDTIRAFLTGQAPIAILDMPWLPIFLLFMFALHQWLGWLTVGGIVLLLALSATTERLSRSPGKAVSELAARRHVLASAGYRNAEALAAMGMAERFGRRWDAADTLYRNAHQKANDVTGAMSALSRAIRAILQMAVLGLGAYLTILGEMSGGAMIAGSIIASRALAPIELAIGNWKVFFAARDSRRRLSELDKRLPAPTPIMQLPEPKGPLVVQGLSIAAPGSAKLILQNVTCRVLPGQALGVIGPSAAGKSTLARALAGAWPVARGEIRLDGATYPQWETENLGRHIGYLPQGIEIIQGTAAANISRFEDNAAPEQVIAAAKAAGIHEMILALPNGYETDVGESGAMLSAGQRQRLALARALYGNPHLVILDEPYSNLDADGDAALARAIRGIRDRGGIAVIVAHRPSAIAITDLIAVIGNGTLQAFGPKDEVLKRTTEARANHDRQDLTIIASRP